MLELARRMIKLGADHGCPASRWSRRWIARSAEHAAMRSRSKRRSPHSRRRSRGLDGGHLRARRRDARARRRRRRCDAARRELEKRASHRHARPSVFKNHRSAGRQPGGRRRSGGSAPSADVRAVPRARARGFVARVEPRAIGRGIIEMGGGRTRIEDGIDPSVGFVITAKPGDVVQHGEPLATVFARDRAGIDTGLATLRRAIGIADEAEPPLPALFLASCHVGWRDPFRACLRPDRP